MGSDETARVWRVAVVGLGIGHAHLDEGYSHLLDRFDVIALCDLDEQRLTASGQQFGVARRTTRYADILAMDEVEIVDLCTPPATHLDMVLAALAAGKEVICEKPLVGSLADMDTLEAAEKGARGRVLPIFQYRWGDGYRRAKHIVDSGLAGRPFTATAETAWHRGADYYAIQWRGKRAIELGGVLLSQAIHLHDMVGGLMGEVASVFARTATRVNPIEVEDCATASLAMASGALVTLSATLGSVDEVSRLRAHFEHVTFESTTLPYCPGDGPWQILPATPEIGAKIDAALAHLPATARRFEGQLVAYHEALAGLGPWPVTLAEARRSLELVTALYASAESGAAVPLPIPSSHPKYADWRAAL